MKTEHEILELVYELNDSTLDTGATGKLVFESSGFHSCVTLGGEVVWDEDEYQAPYIDDGDTQMPIRDWFAQRIEEITKEQSEMAQLMLNALRTVDASPAVGCGASASEPRGAQSAEETR